MKTMEKIAGAIKNNKLAIGASIAVQTAMLPTVSAFASETSTFNREEFHTQLQSGIQNGFNNMVLDFVSYVTTILPYALTVFGAIWGTRMVMRFFKTTAKG